MSTTSAIAPTKSFLCICTMCAFYILEKSHIHLHSLLPTEMQILYTAGAMRMCETKCTRNTILAIIIDWIP
jgi:hypothetical protein